MLNKYFVNWKYMSVAILLDDKGMLFLLFGEFFILLFMEAK